MTYRCDNCFNQFDDSGKRVDCWIKESDGVHVFRKFCCVEHMKEYIASVYENRVPYQYQIYDGEKIMEYKEHRIVDEPTITNDSDLIYNIIDDAMERRDRMVSIFIGKYGISIDVKPLEKESEENQD